MNKNIKYAFNKFFLTVSISLSVFFFWGISLNQLFRGVMILVVGVVENLAQYILSLAKWYIRLGKYGRAALMLFFYAWYLTVFGFFSCMSYFLTTVAAGEKALAKTAFVETVNQKKWEQNNELLDQLCAHLETESATGYGSRSTEVMRRIDDLKKEQEVLGASFAVTQPVTTHDINQFQAVSDVFGWPANRFKIFIFGTIVMFVYVGLVLTNGDIERPPVTKRDGQETPPVTPVTKRDGQETPPVTPVTASVTSAVTEETSICPVCEEKFPSVPGKIYCVDRCKQIAYRERRKERKIK